MLFLVFVGLLESSLGCELGSEGTASFTLTASFFHGKEQRIILHIVSTKYSVFYQNINRF